MGFMRSAILLSCVGWVAAVVGAENALHLNPQIVERNVSLPMIDQVMMPTSLAYKERGEMSIGKSANFGRSIVIRGGKLFVGAPGAAIDGGKSVVGGSGAVLAVVVLYLVRVLAQGCVIAYLQGDDGKFYGVGRVDQKIRSGQPNDFGYGLALSYHEGELILAVGIPSYGFSVEGDGDVQTWFAVRSLVWFCWQGKGSLMPSIFYAGRCITVLN